MIRVGLQLPNFTFPGVGPGSLFDTIARTATSGEQHGFDSVWVMECSMTTNTIVPGVDLSGAHLSWRYWQVSFT